MSYATQDELIAWCGMNGASELVELTDPTNTEIDAALVADKLAQADSEIDARLPGLPSTGPYPRVLVDIACRIARYLLYTAGRPEWIEADYQTAVKMLDDVRMGRASLGLDASSGSSVSSPLPLVSAPEVVFTTDLLGMM